MHLKPKIRWLLFALYVSAFFLLPLSLWGWVGTLTGLCLWALLLFTLSYHGVQRISHRLHVRPLSSAQAPILHHMTEELSRRLRLTPPQLGIIDSPSLNCAIYGFQRNRSLLILTKGAIQQLERDELAALVARMVTQLWHGEVFASTWLSRFMALIERAVGPSPLRSVAHTRRFYPFRLVFRQTLLFPLTLIPNRLLNMTYDASELDVKAARMCQLPHALARAYRKMAATNERLPLYADGSTRHLFLLSPPSRDPIMRVFEVPARVEKRVHLLESWATVKPLFA